jgi:hypothetical protein
VKIDGGLSFVVGPMGAGKTLHEVRHGVATMLASKWWVTNVPLYDDALYRIARRVAWLSGANRRRVYDNLQRRYVFTDDLEHALRHAVHRSLRRPGDAMCRLGWDESLADLNSREWDGGRGKTKDDRAELFERVPMLRKNGVAGFLLVQHEELLDKNARRIANWYVRLQNQRENHRLLGMRVKVLPPLFLAYWYQGNAPIARSSASVKPVRIERYFLSWHRNLYDTLGLYGISARDAENGNVIWLDNSYGPVRALDRVRDEPVGAPDEGSAA